MPIGMCINVIIFYILIGTYRKNKCEIFQLHISRTIKKVDEGNNIRVQFFSI